MEGLDERNRGLYLHNKTLDRPEYSVDPTLAAALEVAIAALAPVVSKIVDAILAGHPDPLASVLHADVLETLPDPLLARVALEAAKARARQILPPPIV